MPTPTTPITTVTTQVTFTLSEAVVQILEVEAAALGRKRTAFVRDLFRRTMGTMMLERSPALPAVDVPQPVPSEAVKVSIPLHADIFNYLTALHYCLGGMSRSAILTNILFDWCGLLTYAPPKIPKVRKPRARKPRSRKRS